ncbi:hypothetical protein [Sanxia water strider virus 8]|uniref:hypothetical protein n=1 Tax=Sanxia water strider virus 8 TaxID=1923407 RepID=UPI00090C5AE5|nr:hypothetical protein [Sanxia water strider virus 8]APG77464.1 hypothetical protein [Sanxia water strider virus 8]
MLDHEFNVHDDGGVGGIKSTTIVPECLGGSGYFSRKQSSRFHDKITCHKFLHEKVVLLASEACKEYDPCVNYTSVFNSWLCTSQYEFTSYNCKHRPRDGNNPTSGYYTVTRRVQWTTGEGLVTVTSMHKAFSKWEAENFIAWKILYHFWTIISDNSLECIQNYEMYPRVQIEDETEQGEPTQSSDKQQNTIITRDQDQAISEPLLSLDNVGDVASSEPVHSFEALTGRWMPLKPVIVSTSALIGTGIATYYLPEVLYTDTKCAPNLNPFENFIYGRMDMEMRIVANANKFCCGKIIVSSKYDTYQADELCNGYQSALARNHVIIDLATNNEGLLSIPFRYHRPYVRLVSNAANTSGVRPSKYATVAIQVLSPLQTGPSGTSEIALRAYYRFKKISFAGMSYRVKAQMFGVENVISAPTTRALKEVLIGAERAFDQLGKTPNQDKPGVFNGTIVIPRPRLNFPTGKGIGDVNPLVVNPHTLTNYQGILCPTDEPKNFVELAQIWGVYKTFKWSNTNAVDTELISMTIDPTSRSYTSDFSGEPTPLEYASSGFAFWNGTIELRFDFVSNMFHTGTVQISAEFGRTSTAQDICESSSTYVKNFHLGEQKSVTFRVPYIYDTIMRRTTMGYYNPYEQIGTSDVIKQNALSIAPISNTRVKVRVLNELRPAQSAPQSIDVLVFMRAGNNFTFHGLKGCCNVPTKGIVNMNEFPASGYTPVLYQNKVITVPETVQEYSEDGKIKKRNQPAYTYLADHYDIPIADTNKWNERKAKRILYPTVQMDNGQKEDQDPTDNFQEGKSALVHVTTDGQMNFKDLLRRPTLLIWNQSVLVRKNGGFFIPLKPPNRQMTVLGVGSPVRNANSIFVPTLAQTTAVNIMDMFRVWRGRMRYTIVVESGSAPIYVSLIPHSGVRRIGNQSIYDSSQLVYPICGANFTTDIIIPTVNPTMTVEVPYDTENTWSLVGDEDSNRNYTWRDKGDYNSGHLCLTSNEDCRVTVWWSAGDDFEIANFYGIPNVFNNGWAYRYTDDVKVQIGEEMVSQDFYAQEVVTKVTNFVENNKEAITTVGLASVPFFGPQLVLARTVDKVGTTLGKVDSAVENFNVASTSATALINKVSDRVEDTVDKMDDVAQSIVGTSESVKSTAKKLDTLADVTNMSITSLHNLVANAVQTITSSVTGLVSGTALLYDMILDLIVAWIEKSWTVVGVAIVRFTTKVCSINPLNSLLEWGTKIGRFIQSWVSDPIATVQIGQDYELEKSKTLWGLLIGVVGSVLGVSLTGLPWKSIPAATFTRFTTTTGISYLVQILRFVSSTFIYIKEIVYSALGLVSVEAQALKMLSSSNVMISEFVKEAQVITSEVNGSFLNRPAYRNRVWKTILQAHQIQRLMTSVPVNAVSFQLVKLCQDVVKFGNDKFMDLSASPVRYEPFVICIEGPPGIGKSHMTEDLVHNLLNKIGYQNVSSEAIYYRSAGDRFWSGYRDQAVVVYDEWINTTDQTRNIDQVMEFMKLKSTSIFVPEMAHLEEKKVRGNPLLVIMLTNDGFPMLADYAKCPEAVLRRRDVVLKCTRTAEYVDKNISTFTVEQSEALRERKQHLQFELYRDSRYKDSILNEKKTYIDTADYLVSAFQFHHARQKSEIKRKLQRILNMDNVSPNDIQLEDPFTLFYGLNQREAIAYEGESNVWTPYEQLEIAIHTMSTALTEANGMNTDEDVPTTLPSWQVIQNNVVETQIEPLTGFLLAVATGPIMGYILKGTRQWLQKCAMEAIDRDNLDRKVCQVCSQETGFWYECIGQSVPHYMCLTCFQRRMSVGDLRCDMCQTAQWQYYTSRRNFHTLTLYTTLVVKGCRTMQWFVSQVEKLIGWKHCYPAVGYITDLLLATATNNMVGIASGVGVAVVNHALSHLDLQAEQLRNIPRSQVGEEFHTPRTTMSWPLPSTSVSIPREMETQDNLTPKINESEFRKLLELHPTNICLHDLLTNASLVDLTWGPEGWKVMDYEARKIVVVPLHLCVTCNFNADKYRRFLERYIQHHKFHLRSKYVDYYNANFLESELDTIPTILYPEWAVVEVIPVCTQTWWEFLGSAWAKYKAIICYTTGVIGVIATIVCSFKYLQGFTSDLESIAPESQYSGTVSSGEASPRHRRLEVRNRGGQKRYFQSEKDTPCVWDVVERYAVQNMMKFVLCNGTTERVMYGTGLFNLVCLIPKHYVTAIQVAIPKGFWVECFPVMAPQLRQKLMVDERTFVISEGTDLAYVRLPTKFPLFKDLRKFCMLESDTYSPMAATGLLVAGPRPGADFVREVDVEVYGIKAQQVVMDTDGSSFTINDVMTYGYSQPGACGSLLLRRNHVRPIMSMHVAGVGEGLDGEGYGVLLTQEALSDLSAGVVVVQQEDVEYDTIEKAKFVLTDDVHLRYLGSVSNELTPHVPTKSKLEKSAIFGECELAVQVEPAILSPQDPRYIHASSPLYEGIKKHGVITQDFTIESITRAKERLWDGYLSKMRPIVAQPKRMTVEQAVVGFPGIDHYGPMDLKTSAGYPYNLGPNKTKEDVIYPLRNEQLQLIGIQGCSEKLEQELKRKEALRRQGIIPQTLFIDTLKDEKRKTDKLMKLGGTRVFCSSPVDYVIACRQNFMHFIAAFMAQRHNLMHAVGVNPTSSEWSRVATNLLSNGTKIGSIDYSNFGPGFNSLVSEAAYDLMIRWTEMYVEGVNKEELTAIVWECIQSVHICNNTVYQQFAGSPSGAVFTTIVNTIVNQLYLLVAWDALCGDYCRKNNKLVFPMWEKHVVLYTYGDDAIFSVSDEMAVLYNSVTIAAFFKQYKIVATDASKSEDILPYQSIKEATFLKRGFQPHPYRKNEWLSPLSLTSIKSSTQWVWKSGNVITATLVNCNAALLQVHGHGPEFYQKFKNLINRALIKRRMTTVTMNWEEIDDLYYSTGLEFIVDDLINQF